MILFFAWVFKPRGAQPPDHSEGLLEGLVHMIFLVPMFRVSLLGNFLFWYPFLPRKPQCFSRAYSTLKPRSGSPAPSAPKRR